MSRKITIYKYEGNTHYSVSVFDSYGTEHHLGYKGQGELHELGMSIIESRAEEIWANEEELAIDKNLMSKAIAECIQSDIDRGVEPSLD